MRIAVAASVLLHLALIVVTMVAWPGFSSAPPSPSPPSIPVELVTIAQETNIRPERKVEPKPEPPKEEPRPEPPKEEPKPVTAPPPQPEPEPVKPEPEPAALPEPEKKPEPKPEEKKPEPKPRPEEKKPEPPKPKPRQEPKKPAKEEDPFAQFEQVLKDTTPDKQQERVFHDEGTETPAGEFDIAGFGRQDDMTMSLLDSLKPQIERCWNFDPGRLNAGELVVEMVIYFNPDGTLRAGLENPRIRNKLRYETDRTFRAAADEAVRAVRACEGSGYKVPPGTAEVPVTFDPSKMLGGA